MKQSERERENNGEFAIEAIVFVPHGFLWISKLLLLPPTKWHSFDLSN